MFLKIVETRFLSFFRSLGILLVVHAEDRSLLLDGIVSPFQLFRFGGNNLLYIS
jgi:hypothetical protein